MQRDRSTAKFWLEPVRLERSRGFRATEIREIEDLIVENKAKLLEAWNAHCKD